MRKTPWHMVLIVSAVFLLLPPPATGQEEKSSKPHPPDSENAKAAKPAEKLPLKSVTLISTDEVARKVAEEASARAQSPKDSPQASKQAEPGKPADGAVLELRPTEGALPAVTAKESFRQKNSKKSVLKNIHGSAYGAGASAAGRANAEGGAVGADSSNGKINIYVEGEHAHASTPAPH